MLSCRLTSGPLWLGIYLFLWWFLLALFGLFVLHWRYELPCQDKLPEFHYTPILGCIRVLWLVFHPLGLGLDKALFGWNSVIGRTFLLPPEENGERHRAKVTRKVVEIIDQDNGQRVENINFILDIGNGKVEELISYNQLLEHLENAQDHDMGMDQELYKFRAIIGHQGPLLASDPDWKGSKYNVQVEWETGEITFEPLSIIAADDPVTCAAYAKEHDLLALEGWRRFRSLAKKDKVLATAIKQSKIRQVRRSQTYMFGYLIPRNYMEAMQFDSENKNSKWYDAIKLEMESMSEYKVFKKWDKAILDKHKKVKNPPKGYHRIKVHLVFAVKFDGRHKAILFQVQWLLVSIL